MRLHRFYIEEKISYSKKMGKRDGEITLADPELIHQLSSVFRFNIGDQVILFDGSGFEYISEIVSLNKKEVIFKIKPIVESQGKNVLNESVSVSLYLALIKKGNFELATEKATEIGISEIHPVISERSEKKNLNIERLKKIVKEASEQSGRVTLPEVFQITGLEEAVSQVVKDNKVCIAFHPVSNNEKPDFLIRNRAGTSGKEIAIFIGPEGGWTEKEVELFKKNNFQIKSFGQNILRAETAAIVAVWKSLN